MHHPQEHESIAVLLAEDYEDDELLFRLALQRAGYRGPVRVAHDGQEVISYLKGEHAFSNREEFPLPQILFLDLKLPGLDGSEVLSWIRSTAKFQDLPVVVLTGSCCEKEHRRAREMGATLCLEKPCEPSLLKNLRAFIVSQVQTGSPNLR